MGRRQSATGSERFSKACCRTKIAVGSCKTNALWRHIAGIPDGATFLGRAIRDRRCSLSKYRPRISRCTQSGLLQMLLSSALEQRRKGLVEIFNRHCARVPFAIDVESRGRFDLELFLAPIPHLLDLLEQLLIVDARLEALLGETGLLGDGEQ